ncbi:hypothetical protein IFM89_037539 [Coptis chinensis]|uniref:Nitronate monooxygenase domain-containing protein n=1 Tax=Coptis chinensis TaxID=261450 RepID=A0A835HZG4_9MAGN|nr:hypothetical protein IFM89_037539 [Coptis chinensis]
MAKNDGLTSLLPKVVDLIAGQDIPIIAAGGIVDGHGYVAALALGAQGIGLGTRCGDLEMAWRTFDKMP